MLLMRHLPEQAFFASPLQLDPIRLARVIGGMH